MPLKVHHMLPYQEEDHPEDDECPIYTEAEEAAIVAFNDHIATHRCDQRGGFGYCAIAMTLFRLLPEAEQVIVGGA